MRAKNNQNDEEDNTGKIFFLYRKKCDSMGINILPSIKNILEKVIEQNKFDLFQTVDQIGPMQIRALSEAITDLKYQKLKQIKIWKGAISDQGIRALTKYLDIIRKNSTTYLDVMGNQITPLGCEFLGKTLSTSHCGIKTLIIDNNFIGDSGLQNLTLGLRSNSVIKNLSLKYCGIGKDGMIYFQEILANIHTKIKNLDLQGNHFGNEGFFQLLRVLQLNEVLQSLGIADTGINLLDFKAKTFMIELSAEEEIYPEVGRSDGEVQQYHSLKQNLEKEEAVQKNPEQAIVLPEKKLSSVTKKTKRKRRKFKIQQEDTVKCMRVIDEDDHSIEATIVKILTEIMKNNAVLSRYDLKYNPVSNDAAWIMFQIIESNPLIKNFEFNNNVDNEIRQTLDTIMRKRTGRTIRGKRAKTKRKG